MRILALSDLHTDFPDNWRRLLQLSAAEYGDDALIVAGDIADRGERIGETLALLAGVFRHVFYVPGNHDVWVRREAGDSLEKFRSLLALCDRLGIHTRPAQVEQCWIVPLFGWYDPRFAGEGAWDAEDLDGWSDFHFCRWPSDIDDLPSFFAWLNAPAIRRYDRPVISFSHFVPRPDLLPPADKLHFKGLPRVAGSTLLERQIRSIASQVHVFGHTHINRDAVVEGVWYVQNALGYPRERRSGDVQLKVIWDTESTGEHDGLRVPEPAEHRRAAAPASDRQPGGAADDH